MKSCVFAFDNLAALSTCSTISTEGTSRRKRKSLPTMEQAEETRTAEHNQKLQNKSYSYASPLSLASSDSVFPSISTLEELPSLLTSMNPALPPPPPPPHLLIDQKEGEERTLATACYSANNTGTTSEHTLTPLVGPGSNKDMVDMVALYNLLIREKDAVDVAASYSTASVSLCSELRDTKHSDYGQLRQIRASPQPGSSVDGLQSLRQQYSSDTSIFPAAAAADGTVDNDLLRFATSRTEKSEEQRLQCCTTRMEVFDTKNQTLRSTKKLRTSLTPLHASTAGCAGDVRGGGSKMLLSPISNMEYDRFCLSSSRLRLTAEENSADYEGSTSSQYYETNDEQNGGKVAAAC